MLSKIWIWRKYGLFPSIGIGLAASSTKKLKLISVADLIWAKSLTLKILIIVTMCSWVLYLMPFSLLVFWFFPSCFTERLVRIDFQFESLEFIKIGIWNLLMFFLFRFTSVWIDAWNLNQLMLEFGWPLPFCISWSSCLDFTFTWIWAPIQHMVMIGMPSKDWDFGIFQQHIWIITEEPYQMMGFTMTMWFTVLFQIWLLLAQLWLW